MPSHDSQECNRNVWARVDETNKPRVLRCIGIDRTVWKCCAVANAEGRWPRQICSVGASLVPTLYSCGNGVQNDGEVKNARMLPPVDLFVMEDQSLFFA